MAFAHDFIGALYGVFSFAQERIPDVLQRHMRRFRAADNKKNGAAHAVPSLCFSIYAAISASNEALARLSAAGRCLQSPERRTLHVCPLQGRFATSERGGGRNSVPVQHRSSRSATRRFTEPFSEPLQTLAQPWCPHQPRCRPQSGSRVLRLRRTR